jgi:transposase
MLIIGCDFHPSVQQIAYLDTETGEYCEQRLSHSNGEAERFYWELHQKTDGIRVGIEATGHARWFERLLGTSGWVTKSEEIARQALASVSALS